MKDNFQDSPSIRVILQMYADIDPDELGEDKFIGHHSLDRAEKELTQLFKDYIEAEIIGEDEALPEWGKLWKESRNDFRAKQREKLKALQQYKSNLLEGLSDG